MLDLLRNTLKVAEDLGVEYADIRAERYEGFNIRVRKGVLDAAAISMVEGVGVRILTEGAWGFSFTEKIDRDSLRNAVNRAFKMAKASASAKKRPVKLVEVKPVRERCVANIVENPMDVPVDEKVNLALEADRYLRGCRDVGETSIQYGDGLFEKTFISNEGAEIVVDGCRTQLGIYAVGVGTSPPSAYELIGGVGGFELVKGDLPFNLAETVADRISKLSKAKAPKGGLYQVVLDNKLLGLIVHEAFGHTAEADMVISGSILTDKIGETVASEAVTIVDDPEPVKANGWTSYDDEGVKARKTVIVDHGVLRSYLHNRETAALMNAEPTGNARAQSYGFAPLIRMRNTYMEAGDWTPEEIIEDTRSGLYLKGAMGGEADSNGVFTFTVQEAWRIENGELIEPYRGVTVSGSALEVLKSIDAVGNDLKILTPGICGKGQVVPVDGGGPHVRCKLTVGGV
jgi:TldD protein